MTRITVTAFALLLAHQGPGQKPAEMFRLADMPDKSAQIQLNYAARSLLSRLLPRSIRPTSSAARRSWVRGCC